MRKTNLPTILDGSEYLEVASGKMLKLGSAGFLNWANNPDNRSFRFIAGFGGEQSFTARKESSLKGDGDYWYGYRRVSGKLHKRYIGKSSDILPARLEEVATALESTPEPRKTKDKSNKVTQDDYVTSLHKISQLEAEIEKLQNELSNKQAQLEASLGETAA